MCDQDTSIIYSNLLFVCSLKHLTTFDNYLHNQYEKKLTIFTELHFIIQSDRFSDLNCLFLVSLH